jgi:hypothetical protein
VWGLATLVVIAAIVLIVIGIVVDGLLYLLVIGLIVAVLCLIIAAAWYLRTGWRR